MARSAGQLHGHGRGGPRVPPARRAGPAGDAKTTARRRCRRTTRACSTGSSRGGSTTAATPTGRTGSTSSPGRIAQFARTLARRGHRALISSGRRIAPSRDPTATHGWRTSSCSRRRTQGRIDVYFVGDSITRRWGATDYPELLANWKRNFFGWNAANFGWGGDRTAEHPLAAGEWRARRRESEGRSWCSRAPTTSARCAGGDAKVADVTRGVRRRRRDLPPQGAERHDRDPDGDLPAQRRRWR